MYYTTETMLMIYIARIKMGSWIPKEKVFGPKIVWNYDDEF